MGAVVIRTFGDLVREGSRIIGYCRPCGARRMLDPASMPPGQVYVRRRYVCKDCRGVMEITITSPGVVQGGEVMGRSP